MNEAGVRLRAGGVIAVGLGNALAFYDLIIFGIFAVQIGRVIYPDTDSATQLLLTLGTFGVGFVTRPVGAWVIGRLADVRGRKPAMLLSFGLAGAAVLGQALVPPYAAIGLAAPILMLLFRLLLGFAIGGEVGPSTAYLVEAAPAHRRGLFVSLQYVTQDAGALLAGIVGFVLASSLSDQALNAWGWRIAMLVGVLIVPFGLYVRAHLEETLDLEGGHLSVSETGQSTSRIAVLGFLILVSATIGGYGLSYLTVYAQTTLGIAAEQAFSATIFFGLAAVTFDLLGGVVSDRVGRKPVMLFGFGTLAVTLIPAFLWLNASPALITLGIVSFWLSAWNALGPAAALTGLTEALPMRSRSATLALSYALAVAIFGGSAQFIVAWLTQKTGDPLSPAYYILAVVLVGLGAMASFPETAPRRRPRLPGQGPA
ncbi:MAG: MFS transporter [Pseudomonadota bacterium]|nr:MFS transporter [Pseudomonadota bacterium]